jgi:hypothetical protein
MRVKEWKPHTEEEKGGKRSDVKEKMIEVDKTKKNVNDCLLEKEALFGYPD